MRYISPEQVLLYAKQEIIQHFLGRLSEVMGFSSHPPAGQLYPNPPMVSTQHKMHGAALRIAPAYSLQWFPYFQSFCQTKWIIHVLAVHYALHTNWAMYAHFYYGQSLNMSNVRTKHLPLKIPWGLIWIRPGCGPKSRSSVSKISHHHNPDLRGVSVEFRVADIK